MITDDLKWRRKEAKTTRIVLAVIGGGLFWLGYHYIEVINRPIASPLPPRAAPAALPVSSARYQTGEPLLEIKLIRDRERSREIEQLHNLLDRLNLGAEVRRQAERELWRLTAAAAKENELENLLKANGVKNNMVTLSSNLVTVIITDKIDPEQVKLIGQLAAEVTAYQLDQIRIVNAP
jgi:phage terminase Nu1 subunit (DNA packaging protein)